MRAVVQEFGVLPLDSPKFTNTAADVGADVFRNLVGNLESAAADGFIRGGDGVMNESWRRFFLSKYNYLMGVPRDSRMLTLLQFIPPTLAVYATDWKSNAD